MQGAIGSRCYWLDIHTAVKLHSRIVWLLSECLDTTDLQIPVYVENPDRQFDIIVNGQCFTIVATMNLIDIEGSERAIGSELFNLLTTKFFRITPETLDGYDEEYKRFISRYRND